MMPGQRRFAVRTRWWLRRAVALWWLGAPTLALAQPPAPPIELSYEAPDGCPAEPEFRKTVEERLADDWLENSRRNRALLIRVVLRPESSSASVFFQDPEHRVERRVNGESCDELASAAALIVAVTLTAPPHDLTAEASTSGEPSRGEVATTPSATPTPKRTRASPPRAGIVLNRASENAVLPASPESSPEISWQAGAGGFVATWPVGTPQLGADVFARASGERWSARACALYLRGSASAGERVADFSLLGGRLEGCPLSTGFGKIARVELCVLLELGSLTGEGDASSELTNSGKATLFWAALALPARLRVAVGSRVHLETQAEVAAPLSLRRFVFERPREEVARAPVVGVAGRIGLGVTFL